MKQGAVSWVLGITVFSLIVIFVFVGLFATSKDATLSAIENGVLKPFFEFVNTDTVDDLPSVNSADFLSEAYAEYVDNFLVLFDNQEQVDAHPTGYLTIVDAPPVGSTQAENVFVLFSPYAQEVNGQNINGTSVRMAQQLGDTAEAGELAQQALVASPKDTVSLRDKKLCVFPRAREGLDALYALHSVTELPMDGEELPSGYSLPTSVRNNEVDEIILHFNVETERTEFVYQRGQLIESYALTAEDQEYFVVLQLDNYLCFFATDNGEWEFRWTYDIDLDDGELDGNRLLDRALPADLRQLTMDTIKRGIEQ